MCLSITALVVDASLLCLLIVSMSDSVDPLHTSARHPNVRYGERVRFPVFGILSGMMMYTRRKRVKARISFHVHTILLQILYLV